LQKAEIDLAAAENDLAKRTITAPFAGTIGLTDVTVGDLVSSSKAITTLDDTSEVTVTFVVPERASGQVTLGQPVTATTEALAGQSFTGEISAIDSRVDASARTLAVEATLPNDANVLKPGMALVVNLSFAGVAHPQVPSLAVQWDREGPYVWKVTDGKVHRVGVQILGRRSGTAIVAGDLAMGEQVVVEGLQRVREGAAVTVEGAGAPSDGQAPSATGSGDGGPQAVQRPSVGPGPEGGARGGAQRPSRG
jgi:RND family efflux transporter MFP subunit